MQEPHGAGRSPLILSLWAPRESPLRGAGRRDWRSMVSGDQDIRGALGQGKSSRGSRGVEEAR